MWMNFIKTSRESVGHDLSVKLCPWNNKRSWVGPYCLLNITIVVVVIFKQVQYMFYLYLLLKKV